MQSEISSQTAAYFDTRLGREISRVPSHLSRVLYIPRHDNKTTHLPLYEAGDRYRKAVRDLPLLGSTLYTTLLGVMGKPSGDNMVDQVAYLADIYGTEDGSVGIRLSKRELGICSSEIQLTIAASSVDGTPKVYMEWGGQLIEMDTSFPIPGSARGSKTISHPYFTLTTFRTDNETPVKLQWQIHPARDGLLRYTLVQEDENLGSRICAIYHHAGWQLSLSLGYSEGVLLLSQSPEDMEFEGVVVASLLGILVQLRMLNTYKKRSRKVRKVKRMFQRSMTIFGHRRK